jgi:hypothetical protein
MPIKKHVICLSEEERHDLEQISRSNRQSEREKKRARILLLANIHRSREEGASRTDEEIARQLRCGLLTVYKVRKRALERGPVASIVRQEQLHRKARALSGEQEAHLVALTCSTPPQGQSRWSLRLLKERLIELNVVENIGQETLRRTLKKTNSNRG